MGAVARPPRRRPQAHAEATAILAAIRRVIGTGLTAYEQRVAAELGGRSAPAIASQIAEFILFQQSIDPRIKAGPAQIRHSGAPPAVTPARSTKSQIGGSRAFSEQSM